MDNSPSFRAVAPFDPMVMEAFCRVVSRERPGPGEIPDMSY